MGVGGLPPLWQHQIRLIDLADRTANVAGFMPPGTGKTRAAIEILRRDYSRHQRMRRTLIFCPLSTCKQWGKAIQHYAPKIPEARILVLTGPGKKRKEKLELERGSQHAAIVITNYQAVGIQSFYDELTRWAPEIIVLDESHLLKDSSSERSKKIYPLAHSSDRRILLTGTPILNGMIDIFGQYKALDPEIFGHSFWKFRGQFFYDKNRGMPGHVHFPDWQIKPESVFQISQAISTTSVQADLKDCLDLPPLVQVKIPVDLSSVQIKAYHSMEKEFVAELADVTSVAEFSMTKCLRLRQILAGYLAEKADTQPAWFDDNPRMDALSELIESLHGKQVILWTSFRPMYERLGKLCRQMKLSYAFLTGEQSTSEKEQSIRSFVEGESRCLISNPAAGGVGVDGLQCSSYSVYYDRGYSLGDYIQSQARNYRAGSLSKVVHYILEAPGTIDEAIGAALDDKRNVSDALFEWGKRIGLQMSLPSAR